MPQHLPLKKMIRTARRPEEDVVGTIPCASCDLLYVHETWCPVVVQDARVRLGRAMDMTYRLKRGEA